MTQPTDLNTNSPADLKAERLIERAFPLEATSLDSVHEKNVRHGHISTLHIWPARRPLAACRAALIATLLPDPGNDVERSDWIKRLGGVVQKGTKKQKLPSGKTIDVAIRETKGGILHWGRENGPDLQFFRDKIRAVYGRAPRVLDPFAGGGAIPLEAMRLGCDVTASDLNPVAWFLLKCTLEYPQKLAGERLPLPEFIKADRAFMTEFLEAAGYKGAFLKTQLGYLGLGDEGQETQAFTGLESDADPLMADLAWHVRAWGWWVLQRAKADLSRFYPEVDGKPTVAYLWARTVPCKSCRATVPLLKTRWLCKKPNKRVLLLMEPNLKTKTMEFDILNDPPVGKGGPAARREHDKKIGAGTMSRSGVTCPFCKTVMEMRDIRAEGMAGRIGAQMTAVVVDEPKVKKPGRVVVGKSYRVPTPQEIALAEEAGEQVERVFTDIPFGLPAESTPLPSGPRRTGSSLPLYGLARWEDVFTPRQLLAMGIFTLHTRTVRSEMAYLSYSFKWIEAVSAYLATIIDRLADYSSTCCSWHMGAEKLRNTFTRFAFPIVWDFTETVPHSKSTGGYQGAVDWTGEFIEHSLAAVSGHSSAAAEIRSATHPSGSVFDAIVTDPPYYDAIPYSDLMDFFYVWLRRTLHGLTPEIDKAFCDPLGPKWNSETNDGELVDDPARHNWDARKAHRVYEDGMERSFRAAYNSLTPEGRFVVVFAHKHPDAWETLVTAIIRAGFIVEASWPIQTEMGNRTRAQSSAALSSSVWLVCKKRDELARPGWDNKVIDAMREKIATRMREYWDADIKGPDFVWAATGPALEAYSKHPIVKKANEPGKNLEVSEFLRLVRRMVLEFAVTNVLKETTSGDATASELDDLTTYYLLHRHDFGLDDAPAGACILYAVSCGLSERLLMEQDVLMRSGGKAPAADEDDPDGDEAEEEPGTGSLLRLKPWDKRTRAGMGYDPLLDSGQQRGGATTSLFDDGEPGTERTAPARSRGVPLIDQAHRLMHIWKSSGGESEVNEYIALRGLRRNDLFKRVLQALIELSPQGSDERALLEKISNHVGSAAAAQEALRV